jgi:hypothetical protein
VACFISRKRIFAQAFETYAWFFFLILIFVNNMNLQNRLASSVTTPVLIFSRYIFSGYTKPTYKVHLESICCYILFAFFFHCLPHLWSLLLFVVPVCQVTRVLGNLVKDIIRCFWGIFCLKSSVYYRISRNGNFLVIFWSDNSQETE